MASMCFFPGGVVRSDLSKTENREMAWLAG